MEDSKELVEVIEKLRQSNEQLTLTLTSANKVSINAIAGTALACLTILALFFGGLKAIIEPLSKTQTALINKIDTYIESANRIDNDQSIALGKHEVILNRLEK